MSEIRTVQPEGPYLLGGLSFGGVVAWEMAQQLVDSGQQVALVALLDTKIGYLYRNEPAGYRRHVAKLRELSVFEKVTYVVHGIKRRSARRAKKRRVQRRLEKELRLPDDLRRFYYYPQHAQAARNYTLKPYGGRVTILSEQGAVEEHQKYWGPLCTEGCDIYEIRAGHHDLIIEPHVQSLVEQLEMSLSRGEENIHA